MVFRNAAEGRPGEEEEAAAAAGGGEGPAGGPELLCPRHRCALEPKAAVGGGWGPPGGLELQLAALGLRPPAMGAKGPAAAAACPCLGPPAAEETSDALLVLEALEPDDTESCSEEEPGSPGPADPQEQPRGAAAARRTGTAGGRKGSLRVRLSRLFRTKSCSGGSAPGDGSGGSRRGAELAASAHNLSDGGGARGRGQEAGRKHRLTRTQSAFSPVVFSPLFTGETVSLVDVDISQRGLSSPHPPTPPPPPRRSLSLLDDISGTLPTSVLVGPMGSSLQSFPLPPPPPPHAPEMKLKGKPDGSFLVRDSSDPRYILSLSFRSQGITHHTRMEHYR
ncbi:UNVERIFIED_CONTAM: hypothetical protein H355_010943, partial [Colinus virginianus]